MSATHISGPMVSANGFDGNLVATGAGAGITDGTGTVITTNTTKVGVIVNTQIFIDVTGLQSSTTDLDIIGSGASAAYLTQIDYSTMGQLFALSMTCLEAPVTGVTDMDLYSGTEATGVFDGDFSAITETIAITGGAAWTLNKVNTATPATAIPVDDSYLYLACGAAGTVGTYTAGQFVIEMWGYEA